MNAALTPPKYLTVPDVPDDALPLRVRRCRPATRYNYARIYRRFEAFQRSDPGAPLAEQIRRFFATLPSGTERMARAALKAQYRREIDWPEEIPPRRHRRDEARLQAGLLFDETDRQRFAAVLTTRDGALIGLLYTVRRAEVTRLRWRDLDLRRGIVYVHDGKGGKSSWTLLVPDARAALAALYEADERPRPEARVFPSGWERRRPRGAAGRFVSGPWRAPVTERVLHPTTVDHWVRRLFLLAGLPPRGSHAFRRTFATLFLRRNPGQLRGLQALLRHENLQTTATYVYPQADDLAAQLAQAFGPYGNGGDHAL